MKWMFIGSSAVMILAVCWALVVFWCGGISADLDHDHWYGGPHP